MSGVRGAGRNDLLFTSSTGTPIRRTRFGEVWPHGTGFHALRHFYASLLIRHGESVKTVQARLGHAIAAETLDTYSRLWLDSNDRTPSGRGRGSSCGVRAD
jgi:integrase